mmetsp:Transcript_24845/g.59014  ORF Transcript_24845/g.59014 Transcript_24845/m.59014 type:complete len:184 (+) Transcript_24845:194-745(+)
MLRILSHASFGATATLMFGVTFVVQHLLDPCNMVNNPVLHGQGSAAECRFMLSKGATHLSPSNYSRENRAATSDLLAVMSVAPREEAALMLAIGIGAAYALMLRWQLRAPLAFVYGVIHLMLGLIAASVSGLIPLGNTQLITAHVKTEFLPMVPINLIIALSYLTTWAFTPASDEIWSKSKTV